MNSAVTIKLCDLILGVVAQQFNSFLTLHQLCSCVKRLLVSCQACPGEMGGQVPVVFSPLAMNGSSLSSKLGVSIGCFTVAAVHCDMKPECLGLFPFWDIIVWLSAGCTSPFVVPACWTKLSDTVQSPDD